MAVRLGIAAVLAVLVLILAGSKAAQGDHFQYLPAFPTWFIAEYQANGGTIRYCLNNAASDFPNFRSQLEEVNAAYATAFGFKFEEVGFGSPSCMIEHFGRWDSFCSGCAANIYYASKPVRVQYKFLVMASYSSYRTTDSHELGHGLLNLHEHYKDSGGTIQCFRPSFGRWARNLDGSSTVAGQPGTPTVMDCGTGFWVPTAYDIRWGCARIDPQGQLLTGCGLEVEPPPLVLRAVLEPALCRDGRVPVELNWSAVTPTPERLYLDLSLSSSFAAGTFLGFQLDPSSTRLVAGGGGSPLGTLVAGVTHYWRVNARVDGVWYPSAIGSFTTPTC